MPVAELLEWQLFFQLEPFGSHYEDLRAGQIVAATYNVNRDSNRRPEPFGPLHFMPWNDVQQQRLEPMPVLLDDAEAQSTALISLLSRFSAPSPSE